MSKSKQICNNINELKHIKRISEPLFILDGFVSLDSVKTRLESIHNSYYSHLYQIISEVGSTPALYFNKKIRQNGCTCSKDLEDLARAARSVSEGHAIAISIHCQNRIEFSP